MSHRHYRVSVAIAAVIGTLLMGFVAPAASAGSPHPPQYQLGTPGEVIDGLSGKATVAEGWHRLITLPPAENPWEGNGIVCVELGRHGKILLPLGSNLDCTVKRGTAMWITGATEWCSNLDPPPFYAESQAAQLRCARNDLRSLVARITLTVDGRLLGELRTPRYEFFVPQQAVQLQEGNEFGYPPERLTYTIYGWGAWLKGLTPGVHTVRLTVFWTDTDELTVRTFIVRVAP